MKGLRFVHKDNSLRLEDDLPVPSEHASIHTTGGKEVENNNQHDGTQPGSEYRPEVRVKVLRAAICNTDLEIIKGYVPGYDNILGHEFVGIVDDPNAPEELQGKRVVGDINCPCEACPTEPAGSCPDVSSPERAVFERNHTPNRTVLGIIGRDGVIAEWTRLPIANLHLVPDEVTNQEAAFTEPLAAAYRIIEQEIMRDITSTVAVVGDGKLGLLVAHVLVVTGYSVTFFGRHARKMNLVEGLQDRVVVDKDTSNAYSASYDVVVEASGSPAGILLAASLARPMGTLVLKSTCSTSSDVEMPMWSSIANDIVVNEKRIVGSRCGPMEPALQLLKDVRTRKLVNSMVDSVHPLDDAVFAFEEARKKGALKVQILIGESA